MQNRWCTSAVKFHQFTENIFRTICLVNIKARESKVCTTNVFPLIFMPEACWANTLTIVIILFDFVVHILIKYASFHVVLLASLATI